MENIPSYIQFIITLILFTTLAVLFFLVIGKSEQINQLQNSLNKLKRSFYELDEQAKLIVRTDLELNKAQEELDKRLGSLDVLQKTSRLISTTLDENEIFHRLDQALMIDLGFEKGIICIYNEKKELLSRVSLSYSSEDIHFIISNLLKETHLMAAFNDGRTFSSINAPKQRRETIARLFSVEHFVISPILTQNGMLGAVFVGNRSNASSITAGDEELISILANQIGQSVENARLFEQVFRSRQELERKVQERTKELASALENVQTISQNKSEFISAVSHELRTPLTSIKGYASLLMTGKLGDIPETVKERLGKINTHSDNLVKLINDLLDIARIESGKAEMNFGRCLISRIIDNVHDLLTPQMKEKNIEWTTDIAHNLPEIMIDSSQIERVFINIINNAIKFTPNWGMISLRVKVEGPHVLIEITDTGIGIAQEDIEKLFDEFYKVDNTINQNLKGTGLGLSLVKKIIEAHNGKIWITSQVNAGSTFHFTLPIAREIVKEKTADS